jgi:hypothetical protein
MIRYVLTGIAGAVVGAGIVVVLFIVANPIPSPLVCSISPQRRVVDCVDEKVSG